MKIKAFLLELSFFALVAAQGHLNVRLDEAATGELEEDQWVYFSYKVEHDRISDSILSVRIKGTE